MMKDEDELDDMISVDERLRRTPPVAEQVRRPTSIPAVAAPDRAQEEMPQAEEFAARRKPVRGGELDEEMEIPKDYDGIPDLPDLNMESDDVLPTYKFASEEDNKSKDTVSESDQERPEKKQLTAMLAIGAVQ